MIPPRVPAGRAGTMCDKRAGWKVVCCVLAGATLVASSGCGTSEERTAVAAVAGLPTEANRLIKDRGLAPDDVTAALATYLPTGKHDDYVMFASGGHGGQVLAIGLPSMRLL